MNFFELIYYAAAAWYIAYVLTNKAGPFNIFARIRDWRGGHWHGRGEGARLVSFDPITKQEKIVRDIAPIPGLLDCIVCLAVWVALVLRLIGSNIIIDTFAIAGVGLWVHSYVGWRHEIN